MRVTFSVHGGKCPEAGGGAFYSLVLAGRERSGVERHVRGTLGNFIRIYPPRRASERPLELGSPLRRASVRTLPQVLFSLGGASMGG